MFPGTSGQLFTYNGIKTIRPLPPGIWHTGISATSGDSYRSDYYRFIDFSSNYDTFTVAN